LQEELEFNEELLKERELYWITTLDTINRDKGYNLRLDSSTGMVCNEETRKLLSLKNSGENNPNYGNQWSDIQKENLSNKIKEQVKNGRIILTSDKSKEMLNKKFDLWEKHPELKDQMKQKCREKNTKYRILQYDKKNYGIN